MFIKSLSLKMGIKEAYYYLFYKLYKFTAWSPSIFPSDFGAILAITYLELSTLASLKMYYKFFHREDKMELLSSQTLLPLVVVFSVNYFMFIHNDNWKIQNKIFDKWSKDKNLKGTLVVLSIVIVLLVNFIFAICLVDSVNNR